jgi:hypothetical protein
MVVKTPSLLLPSTATTVEDAAINAIGSISLQPPMTTTTIAAINDPHCRCHIVNDDNHQKPAVVVCCQWRQWRSLLMEVVVDGDHGNGGLFDGGRRQQRRRWDGRMMTQWHQQQWHLRPMVVA